ncbi:MAG: cytochrome c biogenesis protein ResB [candidate division NC10 bacterium]
MSGQNPLQRAFNFTASVKLAIPLLVLIAIASIVGSLIPQGRNIKLAEGAPEWIRSLNAYLQLNDIFHSWWFVLLVSVLGLSLIAITVKRIPIVLRQRGLGVGLGILLAHVGILLVIGGAMYGGMSGFRYYTHLIEKDVTVLPSLPFVIKLDRLDLKYFPPGTFRHIGPNFRPAEKQESALILLHHGTPFLKTTAAPGRPVVARGVKLLPAEKDVGWTFDLVLSAGGRDKVVPVRPWEPPVITLGLGNPNRILAHRTSPNGPGDQGIEEDRSALATEIFLLKEDGTGRSLGLATQSEPLKFGAWTFSVTNIRRYTGLHVYSRPEQPLLIAGIVILITGLLGYFTRWGLNLVPRRIRKEAYVVDSQVDHVTEISPANLTKKVVT